LFKLGLGLEIEYLCSFLFSFKIGLGQNWIVHISLMAVVYMAYQINYGHLERITIIYSERHTIVKTCQG
jgi:hypothetical protein